MPASQDPLTNSQIAELLAMAGEDAKPPLNRAYRRASRKALLWEEEASHLNQEGRSLTELPGVLAACIGLALVIPGLCRLLNSIGIFSCETVPGSKRHCEYA